MALFPDQVLTSVLVAATFPLDVVKADVLSRGRRRSLDQERAAQAADKPWDDSVRELAAGFPDLVTRMSDHIDWTEQAGEAVVAQTDEVLAAIQRLRAKAHENGYLVDNEAQKVEEVNDKILISSASPGVVYVPTYDTQVVYTGRSGPRSITTATTTMTTTAGTMHSWRGHHPWRRRHLDEIFDDDDWDGWDIDDDIDWDGGDITIDRGDVDIDIDRGDINIGDGDRASIGDGDRPLIGDDDRISIGDSGRPQVERGDFASIGDRAGDRPGAGTLPANRTSISTDASRDVARREDRGTQDHRGRTREPANVAAGRLSSAGVYLARTGAIPVDNQSAAAISRPKTGRTPTVRAPSRSSAFQQPLRSRPSVSSNRGRASPGRAGGGRGRGGGRRR